MNVLIQKFIEWWKSPTSELANEIFHENLYIKDCALGNAKDIWLGLNEAVDSNDFKMVKLFSSNNEASLIIEQTEEITGLYYRQAVYLRSSGGQIIEVISTKESVANENQL